jgi:hypothetical protein
MPTSPPPKLFVNGILSPGDSFSPCAVALYALWGGSHTVCQISLDKTGVFKFLLQINNEFGRLCQGHGMAMPTGTDTMFFIPVHDIPKGKKVTYLKIVTMYWPEKANPHRIIHFTVSGNHINYPPGDVSTTS